MQDSFTFILNNDECGWLHQEDNIFLTSEGRPVHVFVSVEAEKLLKEIEL